MTIAGFSLPESVDVRSADQVADALLRFIQSSPSPVVDASGLRDGGVPLIQILVAGRRFAQSQGKSFGVAPAASDRITTLCETYGVDPALCGLTDDHRPPDAADFAKRT